MRMIVVHYLLLLGIAVSAILAVRARDLLVAAIGLSVASALLAILFFLMQAPLAAVFELSVGAGLVTVLFVSAISLVKSAREEDPDEE